MNREETRALVLRALAGVAPELDLATIDPRSSIRDQYDLDSVDFLNFIVAIHEATGIDIPEVDYPKLASLDDCVSYLLRARGCGPES
jgi:acyl carrier protein